MSDDLLAKQRALEALTRSLGGGPVTQEWLDAMNEMRAAHGLSPKSMSDYDESWRKGEGRAPITNFWRFITGQGA